MMKVDFTATSPTHWNSYLGYTTSCMVGLPGQTTYGRVTFFPPSCHLAQGWMHTVAASISEVTLALPG